MIKAEDVNKLKDVINRYFKTYDVRWEYDSAAFFVDLAQETLEKDFNSLRRDLLVRGYIPMVLFEGGEHIVYVQERPLLKFRSIKINVILLILTMVTTIFVGAINWWSYDNQHLNSNDFWQVFTPRALGFGALFFAFPLMLILGIHELGHYFVARRHGVAASLPFFIPVPVPPLGTFGAFISMREPIPNKKALLDIGVAGPLCGFCVAVPVILIGFKLTEVFAMPVPANAGGLVYLGTSLFYNMLATVFPTGNYLTHPTALAGWVGLLVTFLNLLPAGQLDGGHVARAMFGDKAKYLSYASIIIMLALSFYYQYFGWILFIFIIVFIGVGHPPPLNDITPLDAKRWVTGGVVFTILIGCFTPVPLIPAEIKHDGSIALPVGSVNLDINATANLTVVIKNQGNVGDKFSLQLVPWPVAAKAGWTASFNGTKDPLKWSETVPPDRSKNVTFRIKAPANATTGNWAAFNISLIWKDEGGGKHTRTVVARAIVGFVKLEPARDLVEMRPGRSGPNDFNVTVLGTGNINVTVEAALPSGWGIVFGQPEFMFTQFSGNRTSSYYRLTVPSTEPVSTRTIVLRAMAEWVIRVNGTSMTMRSNYTTEVFVKVLQAYDVGVALDRDALTVRYGSKAVVNVTVTNKGNGKDEFEVDVTSMASLSASPQNKTLDLGLGQNASYDLAIEPLVNRTADMNLLVVVTSKGEPAIMVTRTIEVRVES
jgi:membrane-associated protease RseP (regulator of RpoE activity)